VLDGGAESGVADGSLLIEFTDAVLGSDDALLDKVRSRLRTRLGDEQLVDAAGAVASFNAVVKVADGTGLTVDDFRKDLADKLRDELKLEFGPG
jgi:hypothetical protein